LKPAVTTAPVREIHLLQRKPSKVGAGLGKTSGWVHRSVMQRSGVQMLAGVDYQRIDDRGLHISMGGASRVLAVDNVVICAGQESLHELIPAAAIAPGKPGQPLRTKTQQAGLRYHLIGGAAFASELDAKRAIREGAELAASL
jgi:2,4-dienoyl-CoA reductase (NADPH2)